ncbi:MAG TPA: DNA polymerase III subunit delta, partial [Acidobacteriota bacterium]
ARTAPLFISPWKLIVAEFLRREDDQDKNRQEDQLSEVEEKVLADYFASPSPRTVTVVIYPRSAWNAKGAPVFKFFTKRLSDRVVSKELKPLKDKDLRSWLERGLSERKLGLTPEAKARLVEIVGNDLQQLSSEMDKLISFSARKPVVEAEDVDLVCGWARNPENWELSEALTRVDLPSCLKVLDSLFRSGEEGIKVLNTVARFFQEVLLAKAWLREKAKDRKEIFRMFRPRVSQKGGWWYENKLREYFGLVEGLSSQELGRLLEELSRIDRLVKSSDVSAKILLESFMVEYCRRPKKTPARRLGRS